MLGGRDLPRIREKNRMFPFECRGDMRDSIQKLFEI